MCFNTLISLTEVFDLKGSHWGSKRGIRRNAHTHTQSVTGQPGRGPGDREGNFHFHSLFLAKRPIFSRDLNEPSFSLEKQMVCFSLVCFEQLFSLWRHFINNFECKEAVQIVFFLFLFRNSGKAILDKQRYFQRMFLLFFVRNRTNESYQWIESKNRINDSNQRIES